MPKHWPAMLKFRSTCERTTFMSNNAILYATAAKATSVSELAQQDLDYEEVAIAANRIPVPWFFCFCAADLQPYQQSYCNMSGEEGEDTCYVAVVETAKARENIRDARALFTEFCADATVGDHFWQKAQDDLATVRLPYLLLDVSEIMFMSDIDEAVARFIRSFKRSADAFHDIAWFASYDAAVRPYPLGHLYQQVPDNDEERLDNTVALDMAIDAPAAELNITITPVTKQVTPLQRKPWWQFW